MLSRFLVDRIENRILVGTVAFVGIMLLVGWVAINENARMASFTRQYEARAIERGAKIFSASCSPCHGTDGRGVQSKAPGLNSPHFFSHDYFADVDAREKELVDERFDLAVAVAENPTAADTATKVTRLGEIETELAAVATERSNIESQLGGAANNGYPLGDLTARQGRLQQLGWSGTREAFILTTLIHGRPTSAAYWPAGLAMPAWSQRAGGPLRDDQLSDLAAYIMNFDKGDAWTIEDALLVNQYPIVPGATSGGPENPVGKDVAAVTTALAGVTGDAARGEDLYMGRAKPENVFTALGCSGCHVNGASAPNTEGTWDRVQNERLTLPEFAGYTGEQYLVESILDPHKFLVPDYGPVMPNNFGERLELQDLADIVAYLKTTGQ